MITAKQLSCLKERNPDLFLVVGFGSWVVLVFEDFGSSCSLNRYSFSFGRLMSLHVGPTPPDIFLFSLFVLKS